MQMQMESDEQKMLFMSIGVVVFSVIALTLFIFQSWALFFVVAILGLLLGVYLAYSLSKSESAHATPTEKRRRR